MLKTVLLILTLADDGAVRVTLSDSDSLDECEASREVVSQILTEAGSPPLLARCGESALRVTPFDHATPPEAEIHRYRVELPAAGGFVVRPLETGEACTPAPDADPAVHCARSGQSVLADG